LDKGKRGISSLSVILVAAWNKTFSHPIGTINERLERGGYSKEFDEKRGYNVSVQYLTPILHIRKFPNLNFGYCD